jgi:hypothetical protein
MYGARYASRCGGDLMSIKLFGLHCSTIGFHDCR